MKLKLAALAAIALMSVAPAVANGGKGGRQTARVRAGRAQSARARTRRAQNSSQQTAKQTRKAAKLKARTAAEATLAAVSDWEFRRAQPKYAFVASAGRQPQANDEE